MKDRFPFCSVASMSFPIHLLFCSVDTFLAMNIQTINKLQKKNDLIHLTQIQLNHHQAKRQLDFLKSETETGFKKTIEKNPAFVNIPIYFCIDFCCGLFVYVIHTTFQMVDRVRHLKCLTVCCKKRLMAWCVRDKGVNHIEI